MAARRRCTEYGKRDGCLEWLPKGAPKGRLTCGEACKSHRARRIKRTNQARAANAGLPPGMAEVAEVVTKGAKDAAHDALVDEIRPLVREMLTEDVLRGVQTMIGLTPRAIERLTEQIESADETISQRAVTLLLKYTVGNPSVAPPPDTPAAGGVTVHFNVPRPGDNIDPEVEVEAPVDAAVLRTCADCEQEKPEGEFVAGSDRCQACFDGMRGMLVERFGDVYQP